MSELLKGTNPRTPSGPDLMAMQDQIYAAQDKFDIEKFLSGIDREEHDATDIADLLDHLD